MDAGMKPGPYRSYLLHLLLVILSFNLLDRVALGVLLQDIKVDLALTDTQLGFLTGIAFALFYSLMGIPIARWADRGNRITIITVTTALWSVAVALCGAISTFAQLLWMRVAVAVGEAGCIPPAHSLIADYFSRAERPRAMARYLLGYPLSAVIGYFVAGWLNEFYGWRWTFVALGLPGVVLAAIAGLTLRETRRGASGADEHRAPATDPTPSRDPEGAATPTSSIPEVCRALWANATFRHLLLCWSVISFFGWGISQWKPAFFIRSFGLTSREVGTGFAAIYGVAGLAGTWCGGFFASRVAPDNERLQLAAMAVACALFSLLSAGIYLSPVPSLAFTLLALSLAGVYAIYGPLFATIQTLVPPNMRAMSVAIVYLFANLIGMGLGPLAVGILSDTLRPRFGEESLRYSLLVLSAGYLWAAWHLWRARTTVLRDLSEAREELAASPRAAATAPTAIEVH